MDIIENCRYHRDGLEHICKLEDTHIMPKVLADFGIISKALQSNPTEEDKEKSYWASSHEYDVTKDDWGRHEIIVTEFNQSGYTHYFGVISLGIADAICRVPALPAATNSLEIAKRTINDDVTDVYQRALEFERIENIEQFLSSNPTIVNPVILALSKDSQENGSVMIEKEQDFSKLVIDLQKIDFIKKTHTDVNFSKGIDYRPIDLVDGQHRIRSTRLNPEANALLIPFVVVDSNYRGGGGRLFAEINVQSNEIMKLHKLHLRYVLRLASHIEKDDFGEVPESFADNIEEYDEKWQNIYSRRNANRIAYRVGALLNLNRNGPMHDKILFFGKKKDEVNKKAIDAYDWIAHCAPWVSQFPKLAASERDFVRVLHNYFQAWKITSNTDPKTGVSYKDSDVNDRWGKGGNKGKKKDSRIFNAVMFKQILSLFPLTYRLSKSNIETDDSDMVSRFLEILKPCRPIDGLDIEAWNTIMKAGKSTLIEEHIYSWMSWAIHDYSRTGNLVEPELAWNFKNGETTDVVSAPGQGFFSPINPEFFSGSIEISDISTDNLEGLNQASIVINADSIPNEAKPKSISIMYRDSNGKLRPERRSKHTKGPRNGIGFNYLKQLFQTSTKTHGITSIEITITSGNLFSVGDDELFKQSYTMEELRELNNQTLILSNKPTQLDLKNSKIDIDEFELTTPSSVNHYVFKYDEDEISLESEEQIDAENMEEEIILRGPPPKNQGFFPKNILKLKYKYRTNINQCQACFHGIHDPANCGHNKWWL